MKLEVERWVVWVRVGDPDRTWPISASSSVDKGQSIDNAQAVLGHAPITKGMEDGTVRCLKTTISAEVEEGQS